MKRRLSNPVLRYKCERREDLEFFDSSFQRQKISFEEICFIDQTDWGKKPSDLEGELESTKSGEEQAKSISDISERGFLENHEKVCSLRSRSPKALSVS